MLARWFVTGETYYERVIGTGGKGEAGGFKISLNLIHVRNDWFSYKRQLPTVSSGRILCFI